MSQEAPSKLTIPRRPLKGDKSPSSCLMASHTSTGKSHQLSIETSSLRTFFFWSNTGAMTEFTSSLPISGCQSSRIIYKPSVALNYTQLVQSKDASKYDPLVDTWSLSVLLVKLECHRLPKYFKHYTTSGTAWGEAIRAGSSACSAV